VHHGDGRRRCAECDCISPAGELARGKSGTASLVVKITATLERIEE